MDSTYKSFILKTMDTLASNSSAQASRRYRFTPEEYLRLAELGVLACRTELRDGDILTMSPTSPLHNALVLRLRRRLEAALGTRVLVFEQSTVRFGDWLPEPDLLVAFHRDDDYAEGYPQPEDIALVVEVSVSTLAEDRNEKVPRYARAGVREVWLYNAGEQSFEVFWNPQQATYQTEQRYSHDQVFALQAFPNKPSVWSPER